MEKATLCPFANASSAKVVPHCTKLCALYMNGKCAIVLGAQYLEEIRDNIKEK